MLKGVIPTVLISRLSDWPHAALACGVAAIVGHLASVFIKFRGGKGVATSAGVFLALSPIPVLIAAAVFALTVWRTRMVSAGSILAAIAMTVAVFVMPHALATAPLHLLPDDWTLRIIVALLAALVVIKHRTNVQRILAGTENKF
jgi:glycerol-3-phosphate acyltransferase PlsY